MSTDLRTFLERLLREADEARPHAIAVQSEPLPQVLPGFREANDIALVDPSVIPRAWIGNAIQVAPHFDLMENVGIVVAGRRRFTVFPPEQIVNLYTGPLEITPAGTPVSLVELAAPDLEQFPRFAEAAAARAGRDARAGRRDLHSLPLVARRRLARAGQPVRQLLVEPGADRSRQSL